MPEFYKRPLPDSCVAFDSKEGRAHFESALASGGLENFFVLAPQFQTQNEPAFCGLGTLVTALNALEVDPGRIWKGSWRWYAESLLDCCVDLEEIKQNGISWDEWLCIARCQGLRVDAHRAEASSIYSFRSAVRRCSASDTAILCVAYSRGALGQTFRRKYALPLGYSSRGSSS